MQEILVQFLGWEDPLEKEWARRPTSVLMGFSDSSEVKASACNAGDPGSTPGLGRSLGGGCGNPLQYSCLENPMDKRIIAGIVHDVEKSQTKLSN